MSVITVLVIILVFPLLALMVVTQLVGSSAAAELPAKGKFTKVRGGTIHWIEAGKGKPIVMIHGLGGNLHNFTYALTDELTDTYRVIVLDRPGCGWSERDGAEQATLPEQARMIAEFIEAEGLKKPLVVGHSLGGAIAETLALNHPEVVGGLALICPATNEVTKTPDAFKGIDISQPALIPVIAHSIAGAMSLMMEKKVFAEIFAPEAVPEDFLVKGGAVLGRRPDSFIAAAQDLSQSRASVHSVLGREAELKLPMGVLYGADDKILDPQKHGKDFAEKSGAIYEDLPNRGHMIPLTAPRETAEFVRKMAKKIK